MKISWLHKIVYYVLYHMCIHIMYFRREKITDRTYELSALGDVDKPTVISLLSVFTAHWFYVPYRTRAACVFTLLALVIYVMACILHVSKLCLRKVLNICVRYVGITNSSVTRFSVVRRVRNVARSVYWLRRGCLSVRTSVWNTRLPLGGFLWSLILEHFSKICRENPSFIKIGQG